MKILVVDDDELALNALAVLLVHWGHSVVKAHSVREAIGFIDSDFELNLVVADLNLGDRKQNGFDVLKQSRVILPGIKLCLISCNMSKEDRYAAVELGAFAFSKPIDTNEFRRQLGL